MTHLKIEALFVLLELRLAAAEQAKNSPVDTRLTPDLADRAAEVLDRFLAKFPDAEAKAVKEQLRLVGGRYV
ncbi:hypothetical protein [Aureimonas leprariae]|uniref:Uncharacterized protein n=1 Tax=Plantimonas leprariae TaxID=2615207 RepID=A0A7V7PRU3_9HYPH|nr:hypothetical protein [Aureimonas leprariae]KAB0681749.1 hypothetical protein F6X38_02685 [Aureimonas leprariae]